MPIQPSYFQNPTIPDFDISAFLAFSFFIVILIAYGVILVGVRRSENPLVSTFYFIFMMYIGSSLVAALYYPTWSIAESTIYTELRANSDERMLVRIGLKMGIQQFNITMEYEQTLISNDETYPINISSLYTNNGFLIASKSSFIDALNYGYQTGMAYPIIKILEYMAEDKDSFNWGSSYRQASNFTNALLWLSFASWVLSCIVILIIPHDAYKTILITSLTCFLSILIYSIMTPTELKISFLNESFQKVDLQPVFGMSYWLTLSAGICCLVVGTVTGLLYHYFPEKVRIFASAQLDETVGPRLKNRRFSSDFITVSNNDS